MKKLLCILAAMSCAASLAACGDSSSNSENNNTTENGTVYIVSGKNSDFNGVDSWLTNMWNVLICDIDSYIKYGTSSTGGEYDVEYAISELKASYAKKGEFNDFIHSLDSNDEINARLITAWDKLNEQLDILYNKVISETPKAKDTNYEYKTDLYKQYYDSFQDIERELKKAKEFSNSTTKTTNSVVTTETVTLDNTTEKSKEKPFDFTFPESTKEYVDYIGQQIEITDVITMAAEMIGAEEGTSFKYNGNKFEIYRFKAGDPKIDEAKNGSFTITVDGLGEFTTNTSVCGDYIMTYDTPDESVIQAFNNR